MHMTARLAISMVALIGITACTSDLGSESPSDDYANALPDDGILVNMPSDSDASRRTSAWSDYYLLTAQVTEDVNGMIGTVLGMVDEITDSEPTAFDETEEVAIWGPFGSDNPLEPNLFSLIVEHDSESDTYNWAIVARPKSGEDGDEQAIVAGFVESGATEEASSGMFAMDFNAIYELDPTSDVTSGEFVSAYDVSSDGVEASAGFHDFSMDGENAVNALYHYEQLPGGEGLMDLAFEDDLIPGPDGVEISIIRSRWMADGAGRSDIYVIEGDLDDTVATASECWDEAFSAVYYTDNITGGEAGDASACAYAEPEYNEEDLPAEDPESED